MSGARANPPARNLPVPRGFRERHSGDRQPGRNRVDVLPARPLYTFNPDLLTCASRTLLLICALAALSTRSPAHGDEGAAHRCMATTLYWEARDEGRDGMVAVAHVVLNRMKSGEFPDEVCAVVKDGGERPSCQFSYWCDGEQDAPQPGEEWELAQSVADELLRDPPPDPTGGALFFHSSDIEPPWEVEREKTATIGKHVYYK